MINVQKDVSSSINDNLSVLGLIIIRWYYSGRGLIYLISLIGFCFYFFRYLKDITKKKIKIFILLTILSFYFFHTFFVVSINPIMPGQVFTYRYNVVIFPICSGFISILIYKILFFNKNNFIKITSVLIFLYLITPTLKYVATGHTVLTRHVWNNKEFNDIFLYKSIVERLKYYKKLKKNYQQR